MRINRINIFGRMMVLVLLLLIPIIVLYSYSNHKTTKVIREQVQRSNLNRLTFFASQIDAAVNQLSTILNILNADKSLIGLALQNNSFLNDYYNLTETKKSIEDKLRFQSLSSNWKNQLTVYAPETESVLSSDPHVQFSLPYLRKYTSPKWTYVPGADGQEAKFTRFLTTPYFAYKKLDQAIMIQEVSFSADNLIDMLDQFKQGGDGDPFLFGTGKALTNRSADKTRIEDLISRLQSASSAGRNSTVRLAGKPYLVNAVEVPSLGWQLIDYVPLDRIVAPILSVRDLFYTCIGLLLLMGALASLLLYRYVQLPISKLVHAVRKMEEGDFSVRIRAKQGNEFSYLFDRFNRMTEQIRQLIENVYQEKIRSREATLKQLQSQINPHFLYNSLAFIKSMTQLDNKEAVIDMVTSLSKYYRYTTRAEQQLTTLAAEMDLVVHYLHIQSLQTNRIRYSVDIPEAMMAQQVPKLIVQPIVENAIKHGIEPKKGPGSIVIAGWQEGRLNRLVVEDNGAGMAPDALQSLNRKLLEAMDESMGCGVWNVHQRLAHRFGPGSGLLLSRAESGGLRAELRWISDEENR